MSATIADYLWWQEFRPDWAVAHCVTLLDAATPDQVIGALGGDTIDRITGIDALLVHAADHAGECYNPTEAVIGVTTTETGWVLMAEVNGYLGVTPELIRPLTVGRTVVSHFRNINALYQFTWWHDGRLLTDLDLLFPSERAGDNPDAALEHLHAVGLPLDPDADVSALDLSAAAFALAERITGVACTPILFERADFTVAVVPMSAG
ncbi:MULTISPECIES: DUF6461 domain-containing protein [Mycobacteriaceae]|uniref:Uncharacterized protein n=1 Tax=Mycolicibacterium neoaurum VKM Ac-1815D TaxID=700508 RepID=V5XHA5_MYCNE|nr:MULTISPECIES: DUF6461 domain-containing protein [Mycobacteriaceae]AHC27830.1 hypothetical protein D174_04390 [Mycolicibacterium neoaurum VKM Ac-1815D]AMO04537.1 hypothetical protein MyAD_04290 [Mycolicibacterium neoaurum]AXK77173.1 hypothetical protein DXK33_20835 [Mycolicibacterium neoaurum]KJQ48558.1 hypothetical protein TS71_20870 [Mycolicibacterium neoaurum]KUM06947.1 hypothetical protein AVZ31_19040 [Mycolicibacterium neoaurum]